MDLLTTPTDVTRGNGLSVAAIDEETPPVCDAGDGLGIGSGKSEAEGSEKGEGDCVGEHGSSVAVDDSEWDG